MILRNSINRILMVIVCVTALIFTPGIFDSFYFIKAITVLLGTCLILFKWMLYEKSKKYQLRRLPQIPRIGLVYYLLVLISTFFSVDISNSIFGINNRWEGLILISCYFLLLISASFYSELTGKALDIFLLLGVVISFIGFLQFMIIIKIPTHFYELGSRYSLPYGTLGNPNYLANLNTIILAVSVYLYYQSAKMKYFVAANFIYAILLTTLTRGAWLGSFITILILTVYFVGKHRKIKSTALLVGAFLMVTIGVDLLLGGIIILRFLTIIFEFLNITGPDPVNPSSGSHRILIWSVLIHDLPKHPFFGIGLANLGDLTEKVAYVVGYTQQRAHNELLHIASTTGIPSALIFFYLIFTAAITSFRNIKHNEVNVLLGASLTGYFVQSFFSVSVVSYSYILWIGLGIIAKINEMETLNTKVSWVIT